MTVNEKVGALETGLELLLAAIHADDPKREILVRIGDLMREARAIAALPFLHPDQDSVIEAARGLFDTLSNAVAYADIVAQNEGMPAGKQAKRLTATTVNRDGSAFITADFDVKGARAAMAAFESSLKSTDAPVKDGWRPIETAPTDRPFLAMQDGEIYHAMFSEDRRLMFRTHDLWCPSEHRIVDAKMDGKKVEARVLISEGPEQFKHSWTLWTRGFDFAPTHWRPLPAPPVKGEEK